MKILFATALICTAFVGCATPIAQESKAKNEFKSVNVKVTQTTAANPKFYSESEMSTYLESCIKDKLSTQNRMTSSSQALQLSVSVDYTRQYTGGAFGMTSSVTRPVIAYKAIGLANGVEKLNFGGTKLTVMTGFLGNLKTVLTMDAMNTAKAAENVYLDALCYGISEQL